MERQPRTSTKRLLLVSTPASLVLIVLYFWMPIKTPSLAPLVPLLRHMIYFGIFLAFFLPAFWKCTGKKRLLISAISSAAVFLLLWEIWNALLRLFYDIVSNHTNLTKNAWFSTLMNGLSELVTTVCALFLCAVVAVKILHKSAKFKWTGWMTVSNLLYILLYCICSYFNQLVMNRLFSGFSPASLSDFLNLLTGLNNLWGKLIVYARLLFVFLFSLQLVRGFQIKIPPRTIESIHIE